MIGITDTEKYGQATSNDTDRIVHVIHATLTAEGINVASPEGQEITASLLRRVRTGAGVTPTRVWIRSRLAQDLIDTVEWIGLVIDEYGHISIPPRWRRPSDATLDQFRLPRLAHRLADGYARQTRDTLRQGKRILK